MTENCTIYCKSTDVSVIGVQLEEYWPKARFDPVKLNAVTVKGVVGSLKLTFRQYQERGDDFCRLLLGTRTIAERMTTRGNDTKKSLLSHIVSSRLAIGVVAEPTFNSDPRFSEFVFVLAAALNGIVFNGVQFLDFGGNVLLEPK